MTTKGSTHKNWTLLAVCLGTFMLIVDITIVVVALPSIRAGLHTSFSEVQWTIDAYSLSLASLLLPSGSLGDIFGRRRVFAGGLAIFTLGSLLCALATSGLMLVLFRVFQGIGGATIFSTALALLAQTFQGKERAFALGLWGTVVGAAGGAGPLLGGLLTTELNWHWIFYVNLPIGIFAVLITLTRVQEGKPPVARRIDLPGFAVFTSGLFLLVFGLIKSSTDGWSSSTVVISLAAAVALLAIFPVVEHLRKQPMFDITLFRKPAFLGGAIAAYGINGSVYAMFLYIILYLQDGLHTSALGSGLRLAVLTLVSMCVGMPAGSLSHRVPVRWLIGPGLLLIGIGLLLLRGLNADSSWTHLIPGLIVAGAGTGLVNAPLGSTAVGVVEPKDAGMASGINSTFRQVGMAVSVAALGSIFAHKMAHVVSAPGASAMTIRGGYASTINDLLLIAGLLAIVAAVIATPLIRPRDFVAHGPAETKPATTEPEPAGTTA